MHAARHLSWPVRRRYACRGVHGQGCGAPATFRASRRGHRKADRHHDLCERCNVEAEQLGAERAAVVLVMPFVVGEAA